MTSGTLSAVTSGTSSAVTSGTSSAVTSDTCSAVTSGTSSAVTFGTSSAVTSGTSSAVTSGTSSAISHYREYLEIVYENTPISPDSKWPPTPSREFITLAVVQGHHECRDEYIGHTLQGNVKQVLIGRKEITIDQILEADKDSKKPRLVLIEGAPGIGKSTLAWELCRKYMEQYSLVVLLRLREKEVQEISNVSQLFSDCENEDNKDLVKEVSKCRGRDVLFILDGFDELPKTLQKNSYLLSLINGRVLPASTVLVTSRPSATAELLISCRPQKRIEILGFTQESVEAYASSVFSHEPEKLANFKSYISASNNPAINSLMYVPLNAAIIVLIYQDCIRKSDVFLPHTLTELYIQLCLTILKKYLNIHHPSVRAEKFEDLPADLYKQFLLLSQVAFEGITKNEVIFHTVPSNLVDFGFLDAVSALYGAGSVSYNFLHLTLQEFFTAYHISHLGSRGVEVFKQYGQDERWNVVLRFVAGLTKFKGYEGHMDSDLFIHSNEDRRIRLSRFFIQCLFEAQSFDHFSSLFRTSPTIMQVHVSDTVLDSYAVGYCIANFHTGVPWSVFITMHLTSFMCGLKTNAPSVGIIKQLAISKCEGDVVIRELPLDDVTVLRLAACGLTKTDLIHLSELIPHLTYLRELSIKGLIFISPLKTYLNSAGNQVSVHGDGLLKILQQLAHSNVTALDITITGFSRYSPRDEYLALKKLICPLSGKLEKLCVDNFSYCKLPRLVCGLSSLKYLELGSTLSSSHVQYLKNNTCLTTLELFDINTLFMAVPQIVLVVKENKTLQNLVLRLFHQRRGDIDSLRTLVGSLTSNNTLQSIQIHTSGDTAYVIRNEHKELTVDPRVKYVNFSYR